MAPMVSKSKKHALCALVWASLPGKSVNRWALPALHSADNTSFSCTVSSWQP